MGERIEKQEMRLDQALPALGLAESREKAKKMIKSGNIYVNDRQVSRPASLVSREDRIEVRGQVLPYVSRGGLKLEKALSTFGLDLTEALCMDVGASTGGFTDCMLQRGAARVYALDVGRDQLSPKLRRDHRVISMEETNMRYVTPDMIPEPIQFASVDVSFISLTKILGPLRACMVPGGQAVCLIKPQFEAGRGQVGKKGVIRSKKTHITVIETVIDYARSVGWTVEDLTWSPVRGPEGNIEYLLWLSLPQDPLSQEERDSVSQEERDSASPEERDPVSQEERDSASLEVRNSILTDKKSPVTRNLTPDSIKRIVEEGHRSLDKEAR